MLLLLDFADKPGKVARSRCDTDMYIKYKSVSASQAFTSACESAVFWMQYDLNTLEVQYYVHHDAIYQ